MAGKGNIIDNKYEILKEIGHGGMSVVYLAMDLRLNKQWAVKEIKKRSNDKNNQVVVQSLLVEAEMMKKLDHPALPRIVDIIDSGRTIYVVMDYIEGESLDRILEQNGAQPQELVIDWAKQLCDVLRYLHSQNPPIIYRDMKPANVMLKPEGNLKVIDFGIAREYKEHNLKDTVNLGTRGYAAPEQFGGLGQTDARTDIYCLGATLYHLVTGQSPGEPPYEIKPIRQWNPTLSSGLEAIINKCTQANPDDRYQTCDELMYALEHYTEADESYKKKQWKKMRLFIIAVSLFVIFLGGGFVFRSLASKTNNQTYDNLISVVDSTSYEDKINSYINAIKLYPKRPEAYIKILEVYTEHGFGIEESRQFMNYYNQNFSENNDSTYDKTTGQIAEMNYQAGIIYLYMYDSDENSQETFRSRALKAYPFFKAVCENNDGSYANYSLAQSYYVVCDFYKNYVDNSTSVKEPTKELYAELITAVETCITNLEDYDNPDIAYVKLTMYEAILNLIHEQRRAFMRADIEEKDILNLFEIIYRNTDNLDVLQEKSAQKKMSILKQKDLFISDIESIYNEE